MTRHPATARRLIVRIARSLARRGLAFRRRPETPAAGPRPFVVLPLRTQLRQELQRLERDQFPMWRPDPEKVRAFSCEAPEPRPRSST